MKTSGSLATSCMRMRSPRIAPCVKGLEGSTATIPTDCPRRRNALASSLLTVLLPAPGAPVMPMVCARPLWG